MKKKERQQVRHNMCLLLFHQSSCKFSTIMAQRPVKRFHSKSLVYANLESKFHFFNRYLNDTKFAYVDLTLPLSYITYDMSFQLDLKSANNLFKNLSSLLFYFINMRVGEILPY